jgi:hypothetical protein
LPILPLDAKHGKVTWVHLWTITSDRPELFANAATAVICGVATSLRFNEQSVSCLYQQWSRALAQKRQILHNIRHNSLAFELQKIFMTLIKEFVSRNVEDGRKDKQAGNLVEKNRLSNSADGERQSTPKFATGHRKSDRPAEIHAPTIVGMWR